MVEDGGVSESLNMYLDSAESAPLLMPMPADLGLPEDLEADRIFIHKTANYENYIAISKDRVVAITPDIAESKPVTILELQNGDKVNDITSVGNTIILSSDEKMFYILFNEKTYTFLGNKVPFPIINFDKCDELKGNVTASTYTDGGSWIEDAPLWFKYNEDYLPSDEVWNNDSEEGKEHENKNIKKCLSALWEKFATVNTPLGRICRPIIIRYEVVTLEGKKSSLPILIPIGNNQIQAIVTKKKIMGGTILRIDETISLVDIPLYRILAKIQDDIDLKKWADIISYIRIYVSSPLEWGISKYSSKKTTLVEEEYYSDYQTSGIFNNPTYESSANLTFYADPNYSDSLLLHSAETFLVKEIKVFSENSKETTPEFRSLQEGLVLDIEKFLDPSDKDNQLQGQAMLTGDDMKHYPLAAKKLDAYNKSLLLVQPSQTICYDYNRLTAYERQSVDETVSREFCNFDVTFVLSSATDDKVVYAGNFSNNTATEEERYKEVTYPFVIFPDARAKKMIVKKYRTRYIEHRPLLVISYGIFDMVPHPYLDCAYYYGGFDTTLADLCTLTSAEIPDVNAIDDTDNKLLVSDTEDPFTFPLERRYTFQSKVLGVAVATTALSQGQYGQFPLYVFTEDGIWAMETGADGSFVTSKPLSREVCSNPDSITSIDNAVVFVTKKGVMLLQGSEIVELSPNMNGRHYFPNDAATSLIGNQEEYSNLVDTIKDKDSFVSFMQAAKVAYDYAGQRLIFISPSNEGFQYLYKLDTQSWHKISVGKNLVQPLNSYPECLVQCNLGTKQRKIFSVTSIENSQLTADMLADDFIDLFPNSGVTRDEWFLVFIMQKTVDISGWNESDIRKMENYLLTERVDCEITESTYEQSAVLDFSTHLNVSFSQDTAKGIIITRPFDLGEPDVYKTIKAVKIRGDYDKGNVKYFIQGSDDGRTFYNLTSLRGKSWKMFRLFILADLEPTERISWVDIEYETRFKNRLR